VRALLREPGKAYRLEASNGDTMLIPMEYSTWVDAGKEPGKLDLRNGRGRVARLELELEYGRATGPSRALLANPVVRIGDQEIVFKASMSPGDRLVCRGAGDCRLYRPGREREPVEFSGTLPPLKDKVTIRIPETKPLLLFRAALSWPDLAVKIPRVTE
jgi:hypothetical protein